MEASTGANRGPYLTAALLCERVLIEQDGVKSLIRIVDRVIRGAAGPNPPDEMPAIDLDLFLFSRIVAGPVTRGTRTIGVQPQKPSGELLHVSEQPVHFEGEEDRAADVITAMRITLDQPGLYWFRVLFDGHELTRVPLRVIYMPRRITTERTSGNLPPQAPPSG